ncbi:MAG: hypothetical protein I3J02_02670 [Prevotella sp.]|nr:hypothetical protein [Prevotella sp.]
MKTFRLLLMACLVQFLSVTGTKANSFSDMYLLLQLDQPQLKQFTEGMPLIDLTENGGKVSTFNLLNFSIRTASKASLVKFRYRIYPSSDGPGNWESVDIWRSNEAGTLWKEYLSLDVLKYLTVGEEYILEFEIRGTDTDGSYFFYDNQEKEFRIKFVKGDEPSVKFESGYNSSRVYLTLDGASETYAIPDEETILGTTLGKTSNIAITEFRSDINKMDDNLEISHFNINYGICKKGEDVTHWESTSATSNELQFEGDTYDYIIYMGDTPVDIMSKMNDLYPGGLQDGQEYDLCIGFSFDDSDGLTHSLDDFGRGYRFTFTYSKAPLGPDAHARFDNGNLIISHNRNIFGINATVPDYYNFDLTYEGAWGLTISSVDCYTTYDAKSATVSYRVFEGTTPAGEWQTLDLRATNTPTNWRYSDEEIDLLQGTQMGKTYTLEYKYSAVTTTGLPFYMDNKGKNYRVTFIPGPVTAELNFVKLKAQVGLNDEVETEEINLPPSYMSIEDLTANGSKAINVFNLESWTAETSSAANSIDMYYRIYRHGTDPGEWQMISGTSADKLTWTCTPKADLTAGLEKGKSYVLEFYLQGTNADDTFVFNNGDNNYKVLFFYDDTNPDNGGTGFLVNGQKMVRLALTSDYNQGFMYMYILEDCKNSYENGAVQLGTIPMLAFMGYGAILQRASTDVNIVEVSMQYKVYEPGQTAEWNGIVAENIDYIDATRLVMQSQCFAPMEFTGLTPGKTYILEMMPQIRTADNQYYFYNDTDEEGLVGFKFQFTIDPAMGISSIATSDDDNAPTFNLLGQPVGPSYKGIVIKKGKKFLRR